MPTNKNAILRYQTLDKCFRDMHNKYYIEDLIHICNEALLLYNGIGGVSRRQIFEDIKFMESESGWNIPLVRKKEGKRTFYQYADSSFSINRKESNQEEKQLIKLAIGKLNRFKGLQGFGWIENITQHLDKCLCSQSDDTPPICFYHNAQLKGLQFLSTIIDATLEKEVLQVEYCSYKEGAVPHIQTVHPYFVKQYNNRWFLFALDQESQFICNLAIDRIRSLKIMSKLPFIPNTDIDFNTYFDDVIGVTVPDDNVEKMHIILKLSPLLYSYITAKPLHHSQTIINEEKKTISIDVKPNYELDYHILSLGADIEVLEPIAYRLHIQQKLEISLKHYRMT